MLLKEKITYHANFELNSKIDKKGNWVSYWYPINETVQIDTKEWFNLKNGTDKKAVFKELTKKEFGEMKLKFDSQCAEYRAFKRVVKSHDLEWIMKDCSYSWEVIADVLTLYIANVDFNKKTAVTEYKKALIDNKWYEAAGNLIAIRYEESEKQSQAIVYREEIDRKININSNNKSMHHKGELMKVENRKRAIKAKSLRDVVEVVNHNADVLNDMADAVDEIAELKKMLAEQQARIERMEAAQLAEMIDFEMK